MGCLLFSDAHMLSCRSANAKARRDGKREKIYETTIIQTDMADDQMRAQYPSILVDELPDEDDAGWICRRRSCLG
jgi:hypothetical protein